MLIKIKIITTIKVKKKMFNDLKYNISTDQADINTVGGSESEKVQKTAYVIYEWYLSLFFVH